MIIRRKKNSVIFFILSTNGQWLDGCVQKVRFEIFRERESTFSLDFRPIGPSVFDGARSKAILRDAGYAWTPIWWSSDNSKRWGSFPTWFILWLRAMFVVRDILRLDLAVNLVSKPLNRMKKIPNLVAVNSNPRVSLFT